MEEDWLIGTEVLVRGGSGSLNRMRVVAPSIPVEGPVVWLCTEAEWQDAEAEGRQPLGMAWPESDVKRA